MSKFHVLDLVTILIYVQPANMIVFAVSAKALRRPDLVQSETS
jgi:hypothetical protein